MIARRSIGDHEPLGTPFKSNRVFSRTPSSEMQEQLNLVFP